MPNNECNIEVGCDNYNLMDRKEDGSTHHFIRKICKDFDGNLVTTNLELDGVTEYSVVGDVFPSMPDADECAATVIAHDMWDLTPKGRKSVDEKHCAVPFLRHMVYDCDGKIKEVYDTERDGEEYTAANPIDCAGGGGVPSLIELAWPKINPVLADDDNGQDKYFVMGVENPQTGEIGYIDFYTATQSRAGTKTGECGRSDTDIIANAKYSGKDWKADPKNNSLFKFEMDDVVKGMSSLRLEFNDLDRFEGVWGLSPWPDLIVDATVPNPDAKFPKGKLEIDESVGALHPETNNFTVYAYYFKVPDAIEYYYHNSTAGGIACHSASFTGYTYIQGPCCNCCEDENADDVEDVVVSKPDDAYELTTGFKKIGFMENSLSLPPEGMLLTSLRVNVLSGSAEVETESGSATLTEGTDVSWDSSNPKATIDKLTIKSRGGVNAEINVSWVSRDGESDVVLEAGFSKLTYYDPKLNLPPQGYKLVSIRVISLSGSATVDTKSGISTLTEGNEASWDANSPNSSLSSIGIKPNNTSAEINVSWVVRKEEL